MDDVGAAVGRRRQACRVGDVARRQLDAERREVRAVSGRRTSARTSRPSRAQRMDDPRADEARAARDEDLHDSKFCQ